MRRSGNTLSWPSASRIHRRARLEQLPVAHLLQGARGGPAVLRIPIGRFDPVFKIVDLWDELPAELIEFIAGDPTINLAGVFRHAQFERLQALLADAGFVARVPQAALVSLMMRRGLVEPGIFAGSACSFGIAEEPIQRPGDHETGLPLTRDCCLALFAWLERPRIWARDGRDECADRFEHPWICRASWP